MLRPMQRGQKRPSMLAGLDTADIIEDDTIHGSTQHTTRQALHGRSADTMYNMKYHPMDEVTRPGRGKRQRVETRSISDKSKEGLSGEDTSMSEDEEEMSNVGSSSGEEGSETIEIRRRRSESTAGTRRSSRSATQKPVNYDQRMHPQDKLLARAGIRRMPQRSKASTIGDEKKRKRRSESINIRKLRQTAVRFGRDYVAESIDLEVRDSVFLKKPGECYWPDTQDEIVCKQPTVARDNFTSKGESQDPIAVSDDDIEEEEDDADRDDSEFQLAHNDQDIDDQAMNAVDDLVQSLVKQQSEFHATAYTKEVDGDADSAAHLQADDYEVEDALATMDGHVMRHEALRLDNETLQLAKSTRAKRPSHTEDNCHVVHVDNTTIFPFTTYGETVKQSQHADTLPHREFDLNESAPDGPDDQQKMLSEAPAGAAPGSTPCPKMRGCREPLGSPPTHEDCVAEAQAPVQHASNEEALNGPIEEPGSRHTSDSSAVDANLHSCPCPAGLATPFVSGNRLEILETDPTEASSPHDHTGSFVVGPSTGEPRPLPNFKAPSSHQSGVNHVRQIRHDDSHQLSRDPGSEKTNLDRSSNHELSTRYCRRESSLELGEPIQHPLAHLAERNGISFPEVFQEGPKIGSSSQVGSFVLSSQPSIGQPKKLIRKKKGQSGQFDIHEDESEPRQSYAEEILTHWQNSNQIEYPKENAQDSNEEQEQHDSSASEVRPVGVAETQDAAASHTPSSDNQQRDVDRQIDDEILLSISQSQHVQQSLELQEAPTIGTITANAHQFTLPVEAELPEDLFRATVARSGRSLFSPASSQQAHSSE